MIDRLWWISIELISHTLVGEIHEDDRLVSVDGVLVKDMTAEAVCTIHIVYFVLHCVHQYLCKLRKSFRAILDMSCS